jgi:signal transduction histidine kinase
MLRRLLPTLVALGCGLLALAWGLVSLQRIFTQEREDARAQLHGRLNALEQSASQMLRELLHRRLEENRDSVRIAWGDPLAPAEGYYLQLRGQQLLPRLTRSAPGRAMPARRTYEQLVQGLTGGTPAEPWQQERLALLRAVESALAARNTPLAQKHLDALLRHHAEHPLPHRQELTFLLFLMERLQRGPDTLPLVRALLREGLPEDYGGIARSAGLQRDLLRQRWRFTQPDFDFLLAHTVRLSASLGEPSEALQARAAEAGAGMLVIPDTLSGPTLIGQRWYVEPQEDSAQGIAVELEPLLLQLTREMHARGFFTPDKDAQVHLASIRSVQPLGSLRLEVVIPRVAAAEAAIEQRYGLKTVLVSTCGALALAIGVLAVVAQQRKYRFLELKSDFVNTVSHELRTPLASIRLLAETLERKLRHHPEVRDYPARLIQASDGLHFLVENILSFNRIDKGRWVPRIGQVRLEELLASLRTDVEAATSVPVQLTVDVGDVELEADPSLLRLLLANLGRNACIYNRRSPVVLSVRAHVQEGGGSTVLFSDNGIGIPESEWENVFQDFYRVGQPGTEEVHGSGLGLALCRRIMALHGGRLRITASSPEGTTFSLLFPPPRRR